MDHQEQRFRQLLSLVLDGAASEADRAELVELSNKNPHLAQDSVEAVFVHNLLQWKFEDVSELMALESAASAQDRNELAAAPSRGTRSLWRWAAAALVLAALGIAIWQSWPSMFTHDRAIAQIVAQNDVVWAAESTALRDDGTVVPGWLHSTAGDFTLRFSSGPTVHVVGPASLDIASNMLVNLHRGQATARVPQSSRGFAIRTPVARVVDQGTEFGVVARDDGRTDVIVFEGRVDVREMAGAPLAPRSLAIGEAARIDALGSIGRIMEIGRDTTGQWWTNDDKADGRLIASINDNIVSDVSDKFTCYQTTYGGLHDDALAYADNPHHQWNGLTADGLPEFLVGADYIKTFNDYRYRQDFQLTLEIAEPTNLYIFADNRIPPPDWLKDQFQDTGIDIGLDEGRWLSQAPEVYRQLDKNSTDTGGGQSIDNTFSVWHRRCVEPGPVTLGDAGKWATEGKQGRAMYGIAATPLRPGEIDRMAPSAE